MKYKKKYLITGSAGFIGFHLSQKLLLDGSIITGIDNLNNYNDQNLKKDFGYIPKTSESHGVKKFINWYLSYYR